MSSVRRHLLELSLLAISLVTAIVAFMAVSADAGEERMTMRHRWQVDASYPKFGDQAVDSAIAEWLNQSIADIMESVKDGADVAFTEDEASFSIFIDYQTYSLSDQVLSILFNITTYPSGAAHPMNAIGTLNFFAGGSSPLRLDDLFSDPGRALEIMSDNAKPLISEYIATEGIGLSEEEIAEIIDNDWFSEGSAPTRDNFAALSLAHDGVRVHFQQYQVLPYVFGSPEFVVPLGKLAPAGPNPKVWLQAGKK